MDKQALRKYYCRKMEVAKMQIFRWMSGHTLKDKSQNKVIGKGLGVANIKNKIRRAFMLV